MTRRLFIFAAYDPDGIVDETLLHYLGALSSLGDIVLTMDSDIGSDEMAKISSIPNIIHASAVRHNEYDFGSYKRGYMYAHDQKILNKYDWVYLVNDSVYGPLWDLRPILTDLESRGVDLTGMMDLNSEHAPRHVQSWFIGLSKRLANSELIYDFMQTVRRMENKAHIVFNYEFKLSHLIAVHGYESSVVCPGNDGTLRHLVYDTPVSVLKQKVPFIKKNALVNVPATDRLCAFTDAEFVSLIERYHTRTHSEKIPAKVYRNVFKLTVFSIPLLCISAYTEPLSQSKQYKVKLFNRIVVCKIVK